MRRVERAEETIQIICEPDEKHRLVGVESAADRGYAGASAALARLTIAAAASPVVRLSVLTTMS